MFRNRIERNRETVMDWVKMVEARELREKVPGFSVGDTVKVHVKVREARRSGFRYSREW
jgi:ribosomal protein L19